MVRNRKETTEKSKKKLGLSTQIFIALLAGALLGVVIHYWIPSSYIKDTVIVEPLQKKNFSRLSRKWASLA